MHSRQPRTSARGRRGEAPPRWPAFVAILAGVALAAAGLCASGARVEAQPAPGFVYLADIDASILQDIRYAGAHNFVGRPIAGYQAAACILTREAAWALKAVQAELQPLKLSLLVWDCYRPERAVADFARWSRDAADTKTKREFYPDTDKARLFALGYIANRSGHSRGSTVDLGLAPAGRLRAQSYDPAAALVPCLAPKGERFDDGAIDFGTGYDCLDPRAGSADPSVSAEARANRTLLQQVMARHGFKPYAREWWHFELVSASVPKHSFDFVVAPKAAAEANPPGEAPQ